MTLAKNLPPATSDKTLTLSKDAEANRLLATSPAFPVTASYVKSRIKTCQYVSIGEKGTICCLTLDNDFEVYGTNMGSGADRFHQTAAEKAAYDDAIRQIWPLLDLLRAEKAALISMLPPV